MERVPVQAKEPPMDTLMGPGAAVMWARLPVAKAAERLSNHGWT